MHRLNSKVRFSIPYIDRPVSFWEGIRINAGSYISEVYFPMPHYLIGTGRPIQPGNYLYDFLESGLFPVSVLINPVFLPGSIESLFNGISDTVQLLSEKCNLSGATVTYFPLGEKLKKKFPSLQLTASTLMDVFTPGQAVMLNDDYDYLVPSSRIVRNLPALAALRKSFNGKIRLMVNESCLPDCLFRTQHFYEMADRKIHFPKSLCNETLRDYPWMALTGSWILPQHLRFFEGLYDEIKLAGRVSLNKPSLLTEVLEAYIFGKHLLPHQIGGGPAALTFPMEITDDFYQSTLKCDKNCLSCDLCRDYFERNCREQIHESVPDYN